MKQAILVKELMVEKKPLSKSWTQAAGLLRDKKKALMRHSTLIRQEWSQAHDR